MLAFMNAGGLAGLHNNAVIICMKCLAHLWALKISNKSRMMMIYAKAEPHISRRFLYRTSISRLMRREINDSFAIIIRAWKRFISLLIFILFIVMSAIQFEIPNMRPI